ncbi:hypothetical protein EMPS_05409 [Entomortierella parvispora]|uniref:RNA-directed DNA polymerase n=1 Tax=Entomortierella parvispora TaxID=205924 RepID=A0A9P3HAI2_9FUNG|nr:hypothetical protein EMPS_05409 [Entomortierella parvispora]
MVKTDLLKALTDEIPRWPIANKKGTEASARAWIRELGDFWADEGFSFQLYVVRSKLDDPTKSWLAWWRHAVPENEQNWTKLVKDFAQEHVQERTTATTKAEIMRMTQGDKEPSDDYVKRLELKLAMLPKEEDGKYKLSPDEEEMIALQFCTGLHRDHKFKTRNTEPSKTIAETIKNVSKLGEINRWEDVPDRQRELRDRNRSEETPSQGDNILLGTTSVSRPQFARFKNDFGKEVINNASDIDDLVKLFGAWTITDFTETKPENRVTEAIKRLDVNVARRVLHNTSLSRHVSLANIPPPPAPPIQGNPNSGAAVVPGGSYPPCPECNQMGHGRARCPRAECRNCGQLGHISYNCPNNRVNTTVAQTEPNSRAEQDSSRRVRVVNGDGATSALVATRAMGRTAPASGPLQRNRADRSSVPTGIGSQRRAETTGIAPPIRRMDVEPEAEQEQTQEVPQPLRKLKVKEIAAMKLRKVRIPVVPDPEIIRQVEELEFDPEIVDKHRGRMAPQLKAAIGAIWTERRDKRKAPKEKRGVTFANRASVQPGDQVTAWIGNHRLDNCIVDPGNEKTMISEHAAKQVGLEVRATVNQIRQADGVPIPLVGTTGQFTFSVAGTEVEMGRGMNVIDCQRSYDMLLGDDWLKAVRAKGKWTSNAVAYYVTRNGKKVKLGIDPTFESSDDSITDDSSSEDDDNIFPVFDEDDEVEQARSFRVQEVQVEGNGEIDVVRDNKAATVSQYTIGGHPIDINPELSPEQHSEVVALLERNKDRFTMDLSELEVTDVLEHEINVKPGAKPVYVAGCRRYAPKEKEYLKKNLDEELKAGKIIPMESEWCAPLSFAPKKDGNIRKCVAYIGLNKVTERESWPLPNIEEILDELAGFNYYTGLDGFQGYYVIGIKKDHVKYLGFRTPFGTYAYKVLPFGLKNAPHTFSRFVAKVYADLIGRVMNAYMDDVCARTKTWAEHLDALESVFAAARKAGVKYKTSKAHIGYPKVTFTGHVVGAGGIEVMAEKVDKILNFEPLDSKEAVRSFLGLTGYYRRFVENYAMVAEPLTKLLRKTAKFVWEATQQAAMRELQKRLTEAPLLKQPEFEKDWFVFVDACVYAIGGALEQRDGDGQLRPVYFYSKTLQGAERNYGTFEQECLAIVYCVKKFRPYILGRQTTVYSDHAPLAWLFSKSDLTGRPARWQMILSEFDLVVKTRPGAKNGNADGMSRVRVRPGKDSDDIDDEIPDPFCFRVVVVEDKWAVSPWYRNTYTYLATGTLVLEDAAEARRVKRNAYRYRIDDAGRLLYRDADHVDKQRALADDIDDILARAHDIGGHYGAEATLATIRTNTWWPTMRADVFHWVKSCKQCQRFGTRAKNNELRPTEAEFPFEVIFIDLIEELPITDRGMTAVVVVVDSFTKWVEAWPIRDKTAGSVTTILFQRILCRFGMPVAIRTDGGPAFRTGFKTMCEMFDIQHLVGSTRHPQSQGQVEAMNKQLEERLRRALIPGVPQNQWDQYLPKAVSDINNHVVAATGMSPMQALMGYIGQSALKRHLAQQWQEAAPIAEQLCNRNTVTSRDVYLQKLETCNIIKLTSCLHSTLDTPIAW